jgi:hypothetical protein
VVIKDVFLGYFDTFIISNILIISKKPKPFLALANATYFHIFASPQKLRLTTKPI